MPSQTFFSFFERHKTRLALAVLLFSSALLIYPFLSDWLYSRNSSAVISSYSEKTEQMDAETKKKLLDAAREYNETLNKSRVQLTDPFEAASMDEMNELYNGLLKADDSDVMCFVDIPVIQVYLPVFHGTSDEVLQKGAGHLQGTSLPIGGKNSHAGISAHTGVSSAKMFTDLTQVQEGDKFYLHTLGDILAYEVDSIQIVLPVNMSSLNIVPGEDLCTLITCTPYGVNSHRLLVRGHRVAYNPSDAVETKEDVRDSGTSKWVREYVKAACGGLGVVFGALVVVALRRSRKSVAAAKLRAWLHWVWYGPSEETNTKHAAKTKGRVAYMKGGRRSES